MPTANSTTDVKAKQTRRPGSEPPESAIRYTTGKRCTDSGLAERFAELYGDWSRFCHPWNKWLMWDGRRWRLDDMGAVEQFAKRTARSILLEAAACEDDGVRSKLREFAKSAESAARRRAMLTLAQSEPPIPILPESLDAHPWLLNCENGTLDLRTGTLRAHSRDDKLTKLCPVVFDMDAKRDEWERFLHRIFAGNARLIAYMQRVTGMWLTGNVDEQKVHVFYGAGANGKSVYLGATQGILGPDYSMKAPPDLLMAKNSSHPTERADLFGKRLVCCIETNEGQRFNESLVKDLSGGDRQRARRMREDFWEFEPTHKLVVAVNHKPVVRGTDHGIWRRLRLVPFTVTIPEEEQDKALASKLAREYPGILAWAVQGCLEWQKDGLRCPDEVKAATDEYRQEQDVLGEFIRECCVVGANERERAKVLFDAYQKYTGAKTTQTKFGTALTERGFDKAKAHGVVWRLGIGLGDSFDED